jgi:hypothetical protein
MAGEKDGFPKHVEREVYPKPEHRFAGAKIGLTHEDSRPDYPAPEQAPPHAANVVIVLLDDAGWAVSSAYGGLCRMPTAERLAREGLQYCAFHTTALCAPTRAALLTGRNHHSAATGVVAEMATGYPGYSGMIPRSCAMISEILSQNGWATGWWGKNHNVPDGHTSAAGPFDHWPSRRGFDYFYGFVGGETDQFYPALYRDTTPVMPPRTPEEGYHLTTDLADDCIAWMRRQRRLRRTGRCSCTSRPAPSTARTSRRSRGAVATRGGSTWAGTAAASSSTRASSSSASFPPARA